MTTVATILDAAYARSSGARVDTLASPAELVAIVDKALLARFQLAARVAPLAFAESAQVTFASTGWAIPSGALAVVRVEADSGTLPMLTTGTTIHVIPLDDRPAYVGQPSVVQVGRELQGAGNSGDPTGGTVLVYYAPAPDALTDVTDTLDVRWPTRFNALLELPVALYLARKDARTEDVAAFAREESEWLALFDAYLRGVVVSPETRFGELRRAESEPPREGA